VERKISNFLEEYQPQIQEIRKFLVRSLSAFIVGAGIGLIFNRKIILALFSLFDFKNINIVLTSPYQFVNLAIIVSVVSGLIFATPFLLFNFFRFIRPALSQKEYLFIKNIIPSSIFLFIFGCFFGAKIEQTIVTIFAKTTVDYATSNFWDVENFISQFIIMSVSMGFVFQLPVILTILIKLKVITVDLLKNQRRFVYVFLTFFGILLPPTDIVSLLMVITPLFILFEGTLLLNRSN
jgi:sec-independent protein translocase protein TatC